MSSHSRSVAAPHVPEQRVHWHGTESWRERFGRQLRLVDLLDSQRIEVIKDAPHRTVLRIDLPHGQFYLKHYRPRGWLRALFQLLRPSASRREWRNTVELARRGVSTAAPVAFGEVRRWGVVHDSFFVTAEIPNACPLNEFLSMDLLAHPARAQVRLRRTIARRLAELLAAAHRAGIDHDDLHAGNVLVSRAAQGVLGASADDQVELFLIDLPGVRLGPALSLTRSVDSLVMLRAGFARFSNGPDRFCFWRAYVAARPDLACEIDDSVIRAIEAKSHTFRERSHRRRDKRALANNRDFVERRQGAVVAHGTAQVSAHELSEWMTAPEAPLLANLHRPVKLARGSVLVEAELSIAGKPIHVAYKRYRPKSWRERWYDLFRGSRAHRAWRDGHGLLARGIATARPLMMCESIRSLDRSGSYLATEWIEGALNLHEYAWSLADRPSRERDRRARQLAVSLGETLGRLHRWKFAHRDLKACNLVAVERADTVDAYVVDLDGLRLCRRLSLDTASKNLARLATSLAPYRWVSRTHRLRFLRSYLKAAAIGQSDWKSLWRQSEQFLGQRIRHMQNRGKTIF